MEEEKVIISQGLQEGRYYNANGFGVAIVASITNPIDWAAYIGADDGYSEESCIQFVKEKGCKLSEKDARHFFPNITLPYRR